MNEIIPAVIPQDLDIVREKFSKVLGLVKKVQLDIVDGEYAPVKTWPFINRKKEEELPYIGDFIIEMDMLVLHPLRLVVDLLKLGTESFVVYLDSADNINECIKTIRGAGAEIGLGIKPSIETAQLDSFLQKIDFVQFQGNDKVGYNGIELDEIVLDKIKNFHKKNPDIPAQIDIGVNPKTVPELKKVGVSRFISGSFVFNSNDTKEALKKLQNI